MSKVALFGLALALCASAQALSPPPPDCPSSTPFLDAVSERDFGRARAEIADMPKEQRKRHLSEGLLLTLATRQRNRCISVAPSPEMLKLLLSAGADPNFVASKTARTLLMQAVYERQSEMARLALNARADPNARNQHESPLILASRNGDEELVKLLLRRKANPNARVGANDGSTIFNALSAAARNPGPSNRALKALVSGGATYPKVATDLQPLDEFAKFYKGRPEDADEAVLLLIEAGGSVNGAKDSGIYTPLGLAMDSSHASLPAIEALLRNGADPNRYVLYRLAERRDYENIALKRRDILEVLFRHGARVDETLKYGTFDVRSFVMSNTPADFRDIYLRELDEMTAKYPGETR